MLFIVQVKTGFITIISENYYQQLKKSLDSPQASHQKTVHKDSDLQTWLTATKLPGMKTV